MGRRLILDTNVLIGYERETIDRAALDADELAVAAVSIAEYRVGIELADTPGRAADRQRQPRCHEVRVVIEERRVREHRRHRAAVPGLGEAGPHDLGDDRIHVLAIRDDRHARSLPCPGDRWRRYPAVLCER